MLAGFGGQLALDLADAAALRCDLIRQFGAQGFQSLRLLLDGGELVAERGIVLLQGGAFLFGLRLRRARRIEMAAHVGEQVAQPGILRFFLLHLAQQVADRRHDIAEHGLERVELLELARGLDQHPAQALVLRADAAAQAFEAGVVERRLGGGVGARGRGILMRGGAAEKCREPAYHRIPPTQRNTPSGGVNRARRPGIGPASIPNIFLIQIALRRVILIGG